MVKQAYAGGKSWKLQAWEIGGPDYISLNLYALTTGPALRPCEMPVAKVEAFVRDLIPD